MPTVTAKLSSAAHGVFTTALVAVGSPKLGLDLNVDLGFLMCLPASAGIMLYGWRMPRLHSKRAASGVKYASSDELQRADIAKN